MINKIHGKPEINKIVGMKVEDASQHLKENGYDMRIVQEDGKSYVLTMDHRLDRVNVYVTKGKVVNIDSVG